MRLLIATLIALVASASAFPPRRGDARTGRYIETRDSPVTGGQLEGWQAKLGDTAKGILQNLEVACEAYAHAKAAGQLKQRGFFGDAVRLDARDPTITEEQAKTWEERVNILIKSAEKMCEAYAHAKDTGHPKLRRRIVGDELRLDARAFKVNSEVLRNWGEQAKKIISSAEAAYDAYHNARDLSHLQQRAPFGDEGRLDARDRKITDADLKDLGSRTRVITEAVKSGKISGVEELQSILAAWKYQDSLRD
jgi:hypothetical protein